MIPFASQRGNGQDLATHLLNAYDNALAEVMELRGAIAPDLHGAFQEWQVQAEILTRCEKYLYSLSINPDPAQGPLTRDQYLDYIGRAEMALGLEEQPRAVVFHTKYGREHCHVVWSRIDPENQKAVHLAFDHEKLMRVTRVFAREHGLALPAGYEKSRDAGQVPLYELEQQRRTGLSPDDHKQQVTDAWRHSDNARSFVRALADRGYLLAAGDRRGYVLVDLYGGVHSLPRMIDDKAVRTKEIRAFLERDFPLDSLPSVAEAGKLVATHRQVIEKADRQVAQSEQLAELKRSQVERRRLLVAVQAVAKHRQHALRREQELRHRDERDRLRSVHLTKMKAVRRERYQNRPTGLAAFLGQVSGVNFLRQKLHRYQDAKRTRLHLQEVAALKLRQQQESKALTGRLKLQDKSAERRLRALGRIDRREMAAFMRDQLAERRIRSRGEDRAMASVREISPGRQSKPIPDVLRAFEKAQRSPLSEIPDVMAAFERARKEEAARAQESGDQGLRDQTGGTPISNKRGPDDRHDRGR